LIGVTGRVSVKKILSAALFCVASSAMAQQSQLNLLLAPGGREASDAQLLLATGFVQCDPSVALSRTELEPRGVRFAQGPVRAAGAVGTRAKMVLAPQFRDGLSEQAADGSGYLTAGALYSLNRPLTLLASGLRITAVGQAAYFLQQPPVVAMSLRFERPVTEAVAALDARFGGAVSRRLGEAHAKMHLWYVLQADHHTLTCYREPDVEVAQ
jgi:hypothetical protein